MIHTAFTVNDPTACSIAAMGAIVYKITPEQYLLDLLDQQVDGLLTDLADQVFRPEAMEPPTATPH